MKENNNTRLHHNHTNYIFRYQSKCELNIKGRFFNIPVAKVHPHGLGLKSSLTSPLGILKS